MRTIAVGAFVATLMAAPVMAQQLGQTGTPSLLIDTGAAARALLAAEPTVNATAPAAGVATTLVQGAASASPMVGGSVGIDMPTSYFFRGILQETEGFIAQPYVEIDVAASDTVSISGGIWTSLHSAEATGTFYEADYWASVGVTAGKWSPGVLYTAYTSPDDSYDTVNEVAFTLGYDDSDSSMPLSPSLVLAVDGVGGEHHSYFEFGVEPAVPGDDMPASISFPIKIGLSPHNYYFNENGDNSAFGYFSVGANVSVPLDPDGKFDVHGGVNVLFFSNNSLKDLNNGDSAKGIANLGFGYSF